MPLWSASGPDLVVEADCAELLPLLPDDDAVKIGVWNSKKPCSFMRRRKLSMICPRFMMFW